MTYIAEKPLYNPDAAKAVFDDYEETKAIVSRMGDRMAIGTHPIMQKRKLRRVNFQRHQYYLIYRVKGDVCQIVRIGHSDEDLDKVLR